MSNESLTYGPHLKLEALDRSVRVALSKGAPGDTDEQIVSRAEAFEKFLTAAE